MRRRRQALLARRRALMAARRNGAAPLALTKASDNHAASPGAVERRQDLYRDGAVAIQLPNGWSTSSVTNGISNFRIAPPNGMPEAHASLGVIALAPGNGNQISSREQRNTLGRVSFTDLRRDVIERMISAGGWVVNDRQREIGGHRVFEVIAQTPATNNGKPEQVWNFYFTEANGRIYSLTTHTAAGFTEKLAADAEKVLSTFQPLEASRSPFK
jgi:hypothetical protein